MGPAKKVFVVLDKTVQFSLVQFGTLLKHVLRGSGVGLDEEVGLQPPSKLSTTDGGRAQLSVIRVIHLVTEQRTGECNVIDIHPCSRLVQRKNLKLQMPLCIH